MMKKACESFGAEERNKCVLLLLDEMHIRNDLVYDKHSGELVGFANLGETNEQLLKFQSSLEGGEYISQQLASTMMVFMVKGLFSQLQFPYVQFPCKNLSGDLLYDPFWEAVYRIEKCGLKVYYNCENLEVYNYVHMQVLGATMDGCAVNRKLIKIHNLASEHLHKVLNPFSNDGRYIHFFSDPPHLIKTARNCLASKCRSLWVKQTYSR